METTFGSAWEERSEGYFGRKCWYRVDKVRSVLVGHVMGRILGSFVDPLVWAVHRPCKLTSSGEGTIIAS